MNKPEIILTEESSEQQAAYYLMVKQTKKSVDLFVISLVCITGNEFTAILNEKHDIYTLIPGYMYCSAALPYNLDKTEDKIINLKILEINRSEFECHIKQMNQHNKYFFFMITETLMKKKTRELIGEELQSLLEYLYNNVEGLKMNFLEDKNATKYMPELAALDTLIFIMTCYTEGLLIKLIAIIWMAISFMINNLRVISRLVRQNYIGIWI